MDIVLFFSVWALIGFLSGGYLFDVVKREFPNDVPDYNNLLIKISFQILAATFAPIFLFFTVVVLATYAYEWFFPEQEDEAETDDIPEEK